MPIKTNIKRIQKRRRPQNLIVPPTDNVVRIKYDYCGAQHIGLREEQQDSIGLMEGINSVIKTDFIGVLCDGMGGLANGREASQRAVAAAIEMLKDVKEDIPKNLIDTAIVVNENILNMAKESNQAGQIGTTMLIVVLKDRMLYWCSVGDSRIYLKRDNRLIQINHEHNYTLELLEYAAGGSISRNTAFNDPEGHKLISYIGQVNMQRMDVSKTPFTIQESDRILLASDGLFNALSNDEISRILTEEDIQTVGNILVAETMKKKKKAQDNVSVIVVEYRGANSEI